MRTRPHLIAAWTVAVALSAAAPAVAGDRLQEKPPEPPATKPSVTVPITDGDLARIRKALDNSPAIKIDDNQLRFYVQILARQPSFAEYVKGYDLMNGPTKGGNPMSHQEFLAMVTPKEFYSSGGITAWEQLQFALTNWLGQTFVKKAIEDLQSAKDEREVDDIRARIERELAALRRRPADPPAEPATPAP